MPQTLLTIDMIGNTALPILENSGPLVKNSNRSYESDFAKIGGKIGSSLRVRDAERVLATDGALLQVQPIEQTNLTVTIDKQVHIGLNYTANERVLDMDNYNELYITPRVSQIKTKIETDIANNFLKVGNSVGTPGTTPTDIKPFILAKAKLEYLGYTGDGIYAAVEPNAHSNMVIGSFGNFNPQNLVSEQYMSGDLKRMQAGMQSIEMTPNIRYFLTGTRLSVGATVSSTVTTQGATSIVITGGGANNVVNQGDVFTVQGVFGTNPQSRTTTGSLFQFVAEQTVTLNGSGAGTITVSPMYSGGERLSTITALPQSGAAVVFLGAPNTLYPQNLVYNKNELVFLSPPPLAQMEGMKRVGGEFFVKTYKDVSMSLVSVFDIVQFREVCRIDVIYGTTVLRPSGIVRLWG